MSALKDLVPGPPNLHHKQIRDVCDEIEVRLGSAGSGIDVASFATGGDGTSGNPWTGMFSALTFEAHKAYFYKSGHYAYSTSPNFMKTDIAHIGAPGVFFHHTGTGDGFVFESDAIATTWYHRHRIENITILGHVTTLSGSANATAGTNTVTGTGTSFTTQVAVGDAIAFDSGGANCETRIVTVITDNTHLTVASNWATTKTGGGMKCGKTRYGMRMSGIRNAMLKNITVHDVAVAPLYTEYCVTNHAELFVTSYHDPVQSTEFQIRSRYGVVLDNSTTTWTFTELVVEGTQEIGIWPKTDCYGNTFINGTSEGNKGEGARVQSDKNVFINMDFEANDSYDVNVLQSRNDFIGCLVEQQLWVQAGQGVRFTGGQVGDIIVDGDSFKLDGALVNGTITGVALASMIRLPYVDTLDGNIRMDVKIGNVLDHVKDLTPGSTVNTNARDGRVQYFTSTGNFTLANPTNPVNGQAIEWRITQGAAHTISYGSKFRAPSSKDFPKMPAAGETLYILARYHSTDDKWDIIRANNEVFSIFEASDISAQDINARGAFYVDDMQVVGSQQAAITDPSGGTTVDSEARTAIGSILTTMRNHGLIAVTAPFSLTGTELWIEGQFLTFDNGALVNKWRDRSGQGHHLAQSDSTKRPLFVTGAINGLPCVRFDGSNDFLISGAWAYNQAKCISLVIKRYNNAFKYLYSSIDNFGMAMFQGDGASSDQVSMYAGTGSGDPNGAIDSGAWYLVTAEYNGSSSKIYENGTQVGSTGNPGSQNGNGLLLGNRYDLSLPAQVDVAAAIIYATTERSNVETYLLDTYAL